MASPVVDLFSAENIQSDDVSLEQALKQSAGRKSVGIRNDFYTSPTPDSKAKGSQSKKSSSQKVGGASTADDGSENSAQQQGTSRKKRSRTTPSATDDSESANGRKSATEGKEGKESLWPNAEGEGPVQGSLLEEVLAEKRMALLRSPEVLRFLQQQQANIQVAHHQALLEAQQHDLCLGEVEDDANS